MALDRAFSPHNPGARDTSRVHRAPRLCRLFVKPDRREQSPRRFNAQPGGTRPWLGIISADAREKIRTAQLINRLQNHALGGSAGRISYSAASRRRSANRSNPAAKARS